MRTRWPVGEVVPGTTVNAAGTWASAACTSSLPAPQDALGDPLGTPDPVSYDVAVNPSGRAVPVKTARTCSGVRSDRRSSSRAIDPVTIGVAIDVPLNSTCTPSVAMNALGAGGVLVLVHREHPLAGSGELRLLPGREAVAHGAGGHGRRERDEVTHHLTHIELAESTLHS